MKKFYFLFSLLFLVHFSQAQIINFPDSMFKAVLLSASAANLVAQNSSGQPITIDQNANGEIELSEALTVHQLIIYTAGITNMEGIQFFTNLSILNCSDNQIGSNGIYTLDVSMLPLTNLNCNANSIDTLILGNNPLLTNLYCHANQLTVLDVSDLINLTDLICSNNSLSTLDLSSLTYLNFLHCANNQLR
jgi:hypothetical protein